MAAFHVGIDFSFGDVAIYNENNKETINFEVSKKLYSGSKNEDIYLMFKEVTQKINGKLGFACIYFYDDWGNEIRKNIVKIGKSFGFLNIQIINFFVQLYLGYVSQINLKPKNGDIIWLLRSNQCYIFEIINSKAKMIKNVWQIEENDLNKIIEEVMKEKKMFGDSQNPHILIYTWRYVPYLEYLKTLFPKYQYGWGGWRRENACSMKALIMAKNPEAIDWDVEMQTNAKIDFKINETIVLSVYKFEVLPFQKIFSLDSKEKIVFKIFFDGFFREEIMLVPLNQSFPFNQIIIKINLNGIITIDYFEIINGVVTLPKNLNPFFKSYTIPIKMKHNGNITAIGIDFGTSRCYAAVNRRNGIEIIALDNSGERYLPSYVSLIRGNELCGQIVVNRLQNYSQSTVFDSKRFIGKNFNEIKIDENWPFEVISLQDLTIIKTQPTKNNYVEKSPEEIASVLLKHIKQKAEDLQSKNLNEVVITVPAAFNDKQQSAIIEAGKLAGWKTIHLFPEHIAAAFAYFVDRPIPNDFTMLIFDFGGGTLDVCVMKVSSGKLNVITTGGNANLGGRDFNNILFNHFSQILKDHYSIKINSKDKLKYLLMRRCMEIKHTLSVTDGELLDISDFNPNIEENLKITQQEFQKMSFRTLNKVKDVIVETLSTTNFTSKDIHKVLLVGGSSRMPMVQQLLRKMFTNAEHLCNENPDENVALGAAYYAYHLATTTQN